MPKDTNQPTIWLVLPLPNRALSPNARVNPFAKRAAARKARRLACEAVERCEIDGLPWTACKVEVYLYHKTNRRRDADNAVAMLKSTYDGIVDAGVVTDDTPEKMRREWPKFCHDKQQPRMEVVITKETDKQ